MDGFWNGCGVWGGWEWFVVLWGEENIYEVMELVESGDVNVFRLVCWV